MNCFDILDYCMNYFDNYLHYIDILDYCMYYFDIPDHCMNYFDILDYCMNYFDNYLHYIARHFDNFLDFRHNIGHLDSLDNLLGFRHSIDHLRSNFGPPIFFQYLIFY